MSSTRQLELNMPPEASGDTQNPQSPVSTVTGAVSVGPVDTKIDIGNTQATKNLVAFVTTQDVYIRFGKSNVGAATSGDWLIKAADGPVTFWLDSRKTRFYQVIQATAAGVLKHYVCG